MNHVLTKLRVNSYIFVLCLKILWYKITKPFEIMIACIERYLLLIKIHNEYKDSWERYVKLRELKNQDEQNLRREQFFCLKAQLISTFFITSMFAGFYAVSKEHPDEVDDELLKNIDSYREDFQNHKAKLIELMEMFDKYDEITFDEKIKEEIIAWNFEDCKTVEETISKEQRFVEYLHTLDIQ